MPFTDAQEKRIVRAVKRMEQTPITGAEERPAIVKPSIPRSAILRITSANPTDGMFPARVQSFVPDATGGIFSDVTNTDEAWVRIANDGIPTINDKLLCFFSAIRAADGKGVWVYGDANDAGGAGTVEVTDGTTTVTADTIQYPGTSFIITNEGGGVSLVSPVFGGVVNIQAVGSANAAGVLNVFAKIDHVHELTEIDWSITFLSTSTVTINSGSVWTFQSGSTVNFPGLIIFSKTTEAVTGNVNDYDTPDVVTLKLTAASNFTIHGFDHGENGRVLILEADEDNAGTLTIAHQSGSAAAGNRVISETGADYTLAARQAAILVYNSDEDGGRWYTVKQPTAGGSGTVTSVAMTVPSAEFAVAGSPVTSSGTLAVTKQNQNANLVWAGPASGGAAQPTFRVLVANDLPAVGPTQWIKITVPATAFTAAASSETITIRNSPAREVVHMAIMKTSTAFSGGGVSFYTLDVVVNNAIVIGNYDAFAAVADANAVLSQHLDTNQLNNLNNWFTGMVTSLSANTAGTGNVGDVDTGSVDVWLQVSTPPAP